MIKDLESEQQLYGNDKKLNHYLHTKAKCQHLFIATEKEKDATVLSRYESK